jgi:hypothetical protein
MKEKTKKMNNNKIISKVAYIIKLAIELLELHINGT